VRVGSTLTGERVLGRFGFRNFDFSFFFQKKRKEKRQKKRKERDGYLKRRGGLCSFLEKINIFQKLACGFNKTRQAANTRSQVNRKVNCSPEEFFVSLQNKY
jgi:hypothetical protein